MFLTHALRAIFRAAVVTGDSLWKYVTLLLSGTPPAVTFISDASTSGNVLTLNGDTRPSNFNPYTPGYYSNFFDGTGDYLTATGSTAFTLGTGDFTIECWFYTAVGTNNAMFQLSNTAGGFNTTYTNTIAIGLFSGKINLYGVAGTGITSTGSSYATSTWTHVALVRSSGVTKLYINGALDTTVGTAGSITDTTSYTMQYIVVGGYYSTAYLWNGYVSNFRVIKGTAVYTANFTPPTAPLTAISGTSLLTCQSNRLIDTSANNFAITKNGDTTVSGFIPFTIPTILNGVTTTYLGSGYFDGNDYISGSVAFTIGASDFCIEAWGYWTSFNNGTYGAPIISIGRASPGAQITLRATKTAAITTSANYYSVDNGTFIPSAGFSSGVSAGTINLNTWTHFALTRQGSTFRMFINGVLVSTQTDATAFGTAFTLINIGSDTTPSSGYMTGWVTDARVVVGSAIYTASFDPPAQPLTAVTNTRLLTLQTDQPAANKQFLDNSGNNFPITQVGNATQGTFSPYGANWSNYFSPGQSNYIQTTIQAMTADFTFECWVYVTSLPNTGVIIGQTWELWINTSGTVSYYTPAAVRITTSLTVPLNTWTHIALVRSSGVARIYINGVADAATYTSSTTVGSLETTYIARDPGASGGYNGYISNLRIVNGTAVYTANFTPPTAPLTPIANTSLLICQSQLFVDNSPNKYAVTSTGTPSVQRFSPFSPVIQTPTTYSTFFDGTGDSLVVTGSGSCVNFGTANFTIEGWCYIPSLASSFQFFDTCPAGNATPTNRIQIVVNTAGAAIYSTYQGATNLITSANGAVLANQWTHIALVKSSNQTKLYVNGTQVGTTYADTLNYPSQLNRPILVANGYDGAVGGSTGYLSNMRVVQGTAVYTANFTPSTTPLTAISGTSLLTCQSATHIDNSTNAFTLTQNGDATPRLFNPFGFTNTTTNTAYTPALYGGSAYFDGTGDYVKTITNNAFGSSNYTIECWVYHIGTPNPCWLWDGLSDSGTGPQIFTTTSGTTLNFYKNGVTQIINATVTLKLYQWTHYAFCRVGTTTTAYVNGVAVGSGTDDTTSTTTIRGGFGARVRDAAEANQAYFGDFRIVVGTALYKGSFVPPLAPLTAVAGTTLLLNMDKGAAVDSSRSNDLETVGDAKVRDETPYAGSYYSNYFDGSSTISIPAGAAFNLSTVDFAIEMWVYPIAQSQYGALLTFDAGDQPIAFYWASAVSTNINFSAGTTSAWIVNAQSFGTTVVNKWTHLLVTRSGNNWRTFQDGVLRGYSNAAGTVADSSGSIYVGANGTAGYASTAYISNLRIIKGSIPTDYQTSSTTAGTTVFTPSSAPLTTTSQGATAANVSLLTCQSKSFVDTSSNAFVVTRNGNTAVKSQNPFQKNTYSSMFFDGTGDYLKAPSNPNFGFGTGNFTVECWVNTATKNIVVFDNRNADVAGVFLISATTGYIGYYDPTVGNLAGTSNVTTNSWVHLAWARSGTTFKMFVNGIQEYTGTHSSNLGSLRPASVGIAYDFTTGPFSGYIADLRITNGTARYTANFTPPTAPLPTS